MENNQTATKEETTHCQLCGFETFDGQTYCVMCVDEKANRIIKCKDCGLFFQLEPFKSKAECGTCKRKKKLCVCAVCGDEFLPKKGQRKTMCLECKAAKKAEAKAQPVLFICEICGEKKYRTDKRKLKSKVCDECKPIRDIYSRITNGSADVETIVCQLAKVLFLNENLDGTKVQTAFYHVANNLLSIDE